MVRRILFAFCRGFGASVGLGGISPTQPADKDEIDTEDESDLEEGFVSLCHRMHVWGRANVVPFLSKPQGCNPLECSQDQLGWRCHSGRWKGDRTAEPRSRRGFISQKPALVQAFSACAMLTGLYNRSIGSFFSSLASSSPRTSMSAKQTVEDAIAGNKIVIFSKSYCPYCKRAKNLLTSDFAHIKDQIYIKECAPLSFATFSETDHSRQARRSS